MSVCVVMIYSLELEKVNVYNFCSLLFRIVILLGEWTLG